MMLQTYETQEKPVDKAVLERKMKYFIEALMRNQDELFAPGQFARAAYNKPNIFAEIFDKFKVERGDVIQCLNDMPVYVARELKDYPSYYRQLSIEEHKLLVDMATWKYAARKGADFTQVRQLRMNAENATKNFAGLIILYCKATQSGQGLSLVLAKCLDAARAQEELSAPCKVIKLFPQPTGS